MEANMRAIVFGLLCLVSAICAPSFVPTGARADEAEDRAAKLVTGALGKVVRDENAPGKPVVEVRLYFMEGADAGLKELAALKDLKELGLNFSDTTDAGLKDLAALNQLQEFHLRQTKVTDAGLKGLAELKQLRSLDLG